ncbi:hypothetical protein RD792_017618 [Penstemon davidsonii]|uniref:CG-1 domain-containing protein n=1 Tax=Penstemon davidsonii TaxID=160366 RepID=A0ABR0CPW0_9LAMI|nr:hypothetical protein RD792_017618 [Penstemon davidsonii]
MDIGNTMEEAKARWLRPNEIHAILCNHNIFVLFVLQVGNEERIHVYYAHGEDNPTFVRRCYWLLDKYAIAERCIKSDSPSFLLFSISLMLKLIKSVMNMSNEKYAYVKYEKGSPATPGNSNSSSGLSEPSGSWPLSEESDSALDRPYYNGARSHLGQQNSMTVESHEQRLHEINTLEWEELLVPNDSQQLVTPQEGKTAGFEQPNQYQMNSHGYCGDGSSNQYNIFNNSSYQITELETIMNSQTMDSGLVPSCGADSSHNLGKDSMQPQGSFGRWMTHIIADSPGSADDQSLGTSISNELQSFKFLMSDNHCPSSLGQTFSITDVLPASALSTEHTKILVVGFFNEGQLPRAESNLFLACGDSILPVEVVQVGVFRCFLPPQTPGLVKLYLTFDGHKPISQVLNFEFRAPVVSSDTITLENKSNWEDFQLQMRLAHLLFSSSKSLSIFSNKLDQNALKEAKAFAQKTSHIFDGWVYLTKMIGDTKMPIPQAKDSLFELILQNRLQEWLLEQVVAGCKITERDEKGQGVIHLCAILGYTWAVYPYSCSGLSLDYRDKFGWTALHWAAYYGRYNHEMSWNDQ